MDSSAQRSYERIDEIIGDSYKQLSSCEEVLKSLNDERTDLESQVSTLLFSSQLLAENTDRICPPHS